MSLELSPSEVLQRQQWCREKMEQAKLQGMILTSESNFFYYSGYRTHAPWTTYTRPTLLFMPVKGKPVLFVQTFVVPEAEALSTSCEIRSFKSLLGPAIEDIKSIMASLGMSEGNIGFELGYEQRMGVQFDCFQALQKEMSRCQFLDASDLIWSQRLIKSPYEVDCIRRACEATSYAHEKTFKSVEKGMTEREISQMAQKFMLEGGAEYPGFVIITSGEGNYGRISSISSNRTLQDEDMLWLDLGACYNGYWSDFCRAGVVGGPTKQQEELQEMVYEITSEAIQTIKPGLPVAQLAQNCAEAMKKRGHNASFDCGRMGHGMGLLSTEPPSVTPMDTTILKEGMIINLEPGIVNKDGVYDLEENIVITSGGYEILSGGIRKIHAI